MSNSPDSPINPYASPQVAEATPAEIADGGIAPLEWARVLAASWRTMAEHPGPLAWMMMSQAIMVGMLWLLSLTARVPIWLWSILRNWGIENPDLFLFVIGFATAIMILCWGYTSAIRPALAIARGQSIGWGDILRINFDTLQVYLLWVPQVAVLILAQQLLRIDSFLKLGDANVYLAIAALIFNPMLQCLFSLAPFFVADRRMWFFEASFASVHRAGASLPAIFASYGIVFLALLLLIPLTLGVAFLLAFPAFAITTAIAYRHLTGEATLSDCPK